MRQIPTTQQAALDRLLDTDTLVWLVALLFGSPKMQAVYITDHDEPVDALGVTFSPYPMRIGSIEDASDASLPAQDLTLTNVTRLPMIYLEDSAAPWDGAPCVLELRSLADTSVSLGLQFSTTVKGAVANNQQVTLQLGAPNWLEQPFPGIRYLRDERFPGIPFNQ